MSNVQRYEAEADAARARIVDAVEALSHRLSPQTLVREASAEGRRAVLEVRDDGLRALMDARDRTVDALQEVERSIAANPLAYGAAAAMIGIAVTAGLRGARVGNGAMPSSELGEYDGYGEGDSYAADALRRDAPRSRLNARLSSARQALESVAQRAADAASSARATVADAKARAAAAASEARGRLDHAAEFASGVTGQAGDRIAGALDEVRDRVSDLATSASKTARAGAARTGDAIADNPEAAVLLAAAAGALLALAWHGDDSDH